jgi:hypothetical protein
MILFFQFMQKMTEGENSKANLYIWGKHPNNDEPQAA